MAGFAAKRRARRDPLLRLGGDQRPAPAASRTARITLQRTGRSGPATQKKATGNVLCQIFAVIIMLMAQLFIPRVGSRSAGRATQSQNRIQSVFGKESLSPPFLFLVLSFLPGLTGFDVAESRVGGSDGLKTLPLFNSGRFRRRIGWAKLSTRTLN